MKENAWGAEEALGEINKALCEYIPLMWEQIVKDTQCLSPVGMAKLPFSIRGIENPSLGLCLDVASVSEMVYSSFLLPDSYACRLLS